MYGVVHRKIIQTSSDIVQYCLYVCVQFSSNIVSIIVVCKVERNLIHDFFKEYFGSDFDEEQAVTLEGIKFEGVIYSSKVGGYSTFYCQMALAKGRLKNDADLAVFDLLFKIDLENGADSTKILNQLCCFGAFGAVKVRANSKIEIQFPFRESTAPKSISSGLTKMEEISLKV